MRMARLLLLLVVAGMAVTASIGCRAGTVRQERNPETSLHGGALPLRQGRFRRHSIPPI